MSEQLTTADYRILDIIQNDATSTLATIAKQVGLAGSPCWRRIKRLEEYGFVRRRVSLLDREKLGLSCEIYCSVKLTLPTEGNLETFENAVMRWPEIMQCALVTGSADYELRITTRDIAAFDRFLREKILQLQVVSSVESRIVMRSVKHSTVLPLHQVAV